MQLSRTAMQRCAWRSCKVRCKRRRSVLPERVLDDLDLARGVDQRRIDLARVLHRVGDGLLGDGVEHHALQRNILFQRLLGAQHRLRAAQAAQVEDDIADPQQMRVIAAVAQGCGDGDIRLTVWQNLLISGVADANVATVTAAIARLIELCLEPSS